MSEKCWLRDGGKMKSVNFGYSELTNSLYVINPSNQHDRLDKTGELEHLIARIAESNSGIFRLGTLRLKVLKDGEN